MSDITIETAARLATDVLNTQPLAADYSIEQDNATRVAPACILDLVDAGQLVSQDRRHIDHQQVEDLFRRTRVISGHGHSFVRASITPLRESGPVDPLQDPITKQWNMKRRFCGYDFTNRNSLPAFERQAGVAGVWPLSEADLAHARNDNAFFLPAMKGFVSNNLIHIVTGYALDLTTKRRWVNSRPATTQEKARLLGEGSHHDDNAWLTVPKGPIAAYTTGTA